MAWAKAYLCTKWHLDPCIRLAAIDMGRKLGRGSAPFLGRVAGSPSNTKSPWLTIVTDRQTGQTDRHDRQRTDSIRRTVLQMVAQKLVATAIKEFLVLFVSIVLHHTKLRVPYSRGGRCPQCPLCLRLCVKGVVYGTACDLESWPCTCLI